MFLYLSIDGGSPSYIVGAAVGGSAAVVILIVVVPGGVFIGYRYTSRDKGDGIILILYVHFHFLKQKPNQNQRSQRNPRMQTSISLRKYPVNISYIHV